MQTHSNIYAGASWLTEKSFSEKSENSLKKQSAQEWRNRIPNATNGSIPYILVLAGSESTITEITQYINFSQIKGPVDFEYKSD